MRAHAIPYYPGVAHDISFSGSLCFATPEDAEAALDRLARAGTIAHPQRHHAMLRFDREISAPEASWKAAISALHELEPLAWCGHLECTFDDEEPIVIFPRSARSPTWWQRVGRALSRRQAVEPNLRTITPRWDSERATLEPGPVHTYRFEFTDCRVLVLYAVSSDDDELTPAHASFVWGTEVEYDPFEADYAPYLSVVDLRCVASTLNDALDDEDLDRPARGELKQMLNWVRDTGSPWFVYQLEPIELAGDGRAMGLEAEKRRASERRAAPPTTSAPTARRNDPAPPTDHLVPIEADPGRLFRVAQQRGEDGVRRVAICTVEQKQALDVSRERLEISVAGIAPITYFGPQGGAGVMLIFEEPAGEPSARRIDSLGPMPESVACALACEVATIVAGVHAAGSHLHGGLHPELTWIVETDSELRASGIAHYLRDLVANEDTTHMTDDRGPMFAGRYVGLISAEVATARPVGPATDVFDLCAMVQYWVTGDGLYEGDSLMQVIIAAVAGRRKPAETISTELARVLELGLAVDSARRCDINRLQAALESLVAAR